MKAKQLALDITSNTRKAKPFLKWAGGKGQLIEQIDRHFPPELANGSIDRYIEPFVGGGAVFLHVAQNYSISELYINDVNPELILVYRVVQSHVEDLIRILQRMEKDYLKRHKDDRKIYYYAVRKKFNSLKLGIDYKRIGCDPPGGNLQVARFPCIGYEDVNRAAQIIFLNRTCFNGLFRVNSKGEFNVPMGEYKKPLICDRDNLQAVSSILEKTHIRYGDFTGCEDLVNCRSLIYFDPPYRPISKTASFNSYSFQTFDDTEQLRLRDFYQRLDACRAKLLLSNSDPKNENPDDNFFENAYKGYNLYRVRAARNINSKASKRGQIDELLITNF